jgi:hypothetical protein
VQVQVQVQVQNHKPSLFLRLISNCGDISGFSTNQNFLKQQHRRDCQVDERRSALFPLLLSSSSFKITQNKCIRQVLMY